MVINHSGGHPYTANLLIGIQYKKGNFPTRYTHFSLHMHLLNITRVILFTFDVGTFSQLLHKWKKITPLSHFSNLAIMCSHFSFTLDGVCGEVYL